MEVIRKEEDSGITQFSKLRIGKTFLCVNNGNSPIPIDVSSVFIKTSHFNTDNAIKLSDETVWSIKEYRDVICIKGRWVEEGATLT